MNLTNTSVKPYQNVMKRLKVDYDFYFQSREKKLKKIWKEPKYSLKNAKNFCKNTNPSIGLMPF